MVSVRFPSSLTPAHPLIPQDRYGGTAAFDKTLARINEALTKKVEQKVSWGYRRGAEWAGVLVAGVGSFHGGVVGVDCIVGLGGVCAHQPRKWSGR
jgi:hypothetical protein